MPSFGLVKEAPSFIAWVYSQTRHEWEAWAGGETRRDAAKALARMGGTGTVLPRGEHPNDGEPEPAPSYHRRTA